MNVVEILAALSQLLDDRQRLNRRQSSGGRGELAADMNIWLAARSSPGCSIQSV